MKRALFTLLGILVGSALAWICLLSWAAFNLDAADSLFDRDPQAMKLFLWGWLALATMGGVVGMKAFGRASR